MISIATRRFAVFAFAASAVMLIGCGDDSTSPPAAVTSVEVTPATPTVIVGNTVQLTATTKAGTAVVTGRAVAWTSDDIGVATVSNGTVTGVSAGSTRINATSEGVTGSTTVTVDDVPVASVTLTPDSAANATLIAGDSLDLTATTTDASQNVLTGRTVLFSTSDAGVATVTASGRIYAAGPGTARIIATSEGKADTANVTVVQPFALQSVNGNPVPTSLFGLTFAGGQYVLYANGRYRSRIDFTGGTQPFIDTGAYTLTGTSITATSDTPGVDVASGTLSGNVLTLTSGSGATAVTLVFQQ